jgi:hypothetical protein
MSLTALANDEILRTDRRALDLDPVVEPRLAAFVASHPQTFNAHQLRTAFRSVAAADPLQKTPASNALDSLVKYIPTEVITLYVAAAAALSSLTATFPVITPWRLYWGFVALTPVLFLLIYIGKRRAQKLPPLPRGFATWPWWKLIASTFAFMTWALAIPPLLTTEADKVLAGFGALLISTMLSVVGGAVEPPEA